MSTEQQHDGAGGPSPKFDFRATLARARSALQRGARATATWWTQAMAPERRQRTLTIAGSGLAAVLMVALFAMPGAAPSQESHEAQQQEYAMSGIELFESLMMKRPELRDDSRIEIGPERQGATNRLVLPDEIWTLLDTEQRISLGTWLETIGGKWEIRIGVMTQDNTAVRDTRPVMDNVMWNRQLK